MHAKTLEDIIAPYQHLPKVVQTALLRVETHPTFRIVTKGELRVLKALVTRANATNGVTPIRARLETVALQADVSTKTTQRAIRAFRKYGWVNAATDGRSKYGVFCSKQYVFSSELCTLLHLPTKEKPLPALDEKTEMSDGGIHDLSFKKDQQEISLQNRLQNPTPIKLPESLQRMALATGIKDSGIAKLRGLAHQVGYRLEDVYMVAKKSLAKIGANGARCYCYLLAVINNPKRTDFAAKAEQLQRLDDAATSKSIEEAAWLKYRFKRYAAGPGRTVTLLHDSAQVHEQDNLITIIAWRDIGQVINDIEDGVLTEIVGYVEPERNPFRYDGVSQGEQAKAARGLLGQTLIAQEQAMLVELARKALPKGKDANLSMALNTLRTRGKMPARAPEEVVLPQRRTLAASVASGLEKARALVGAAMPRFSAA